MKKPKRVRICQEIKHNDKVHESPETICEAFADFYQNLYSSLSQDDDFDPETFADVTTDYKKFKSKCENDTDIYLPGGQFIEDEIVDAIKQLKRRKACGIDKVQNEHL